MKIIHQDGFTTEELSSYRPIIYKNVLDSAQAIVLTMRKIAVDCVLPENRVCSVSTDYHLCHPFTFALCYDENTTDLYPSLAAKRRKNHGLPHRLEPGVHLLRGRRRGDPPALEGPRHPRGDGPLVRVLPHGQRELVRSLLSSPPLNAFHHICEREC
jgi:hypothetical protein